MEIRGLPTNVSIMVNNGCTYSGMFVVAYVLASGVPCRSGLLTVHAQPSVHDTQKWPHTNRSYSGVASVAYTSTYIHT